MNIDNHCIKIEKFMQFEAWKWNKLIFKIIEMHETGKKFSQNHYFPPKKISQKNIFFQREKTGPLARILCVFNIKKQFVELKKAASVDFTRNLE